ncbi:hypothetical protein [Streptomyces tirandamycinicus]|uniref:Uncharacterized protein n=1 Tax=Streptomyces tirandamycinicus TaxID=2174846 RepID=A0A2S1T1V2_9ACTN|nr:hypothetical protein [Streptomyces tirandamycinicus]AWI32642.1 hypothetical protein DDW44_30450 [Streptomyces tirandamycinicus]
MTRSRQTFEQIRAAVILGALGALLVLAAAAVVGAVRSAPSGPTRPPATVTVVAEDDQEDTVAAYNAGDDNRDGVIEEDESGRDCATMGNRQCGPVPNAPLAAPLECEHNDAPQDVFRLCLKVAAQPPYAWTNPDGSGGEAPDGRARIADLDVGPGTPAWADALRALDAEYREHTTRH